MDISIWDYLRANLVIVWSNNFLSTCNFLPDFSYKMSRQIYTSVIVVLVFLLGSSHLKSQITCNSFCITDIQMDTFTPNVMNITIFFEGDENDFINYPYVSAFVDPMWDTIGTGTVNFFGQIGNTNQTYSINTTLDELPSNFRGYAYFNFDTTQCLLYYSEGVPCTILSIEDNQSKAEIKVYPNPFNTVTFIQADQTFKDLKLLMYNSQGQLVRELFNISGEKIMLDRDGLTEGMYYLKLIDKKFIVVKSLLIVN